jgi:hypothetical protein
MASNEEQEDDRARTEMELALASIPEEDRYDPWKKYDELEFERHKAHTESAVLEIQKSMLSGAVEAAQRCGMIDHDEYAKYLLDETGTYMPKLIKTK